MNFLCSANQRQLDNLQRVLIFATDQATYDLITSLQLPVHVFYHEATFGDMPTEAAHRYADKTFMRMMMVKVFSVHMAMILGYSVVFQDADVVWFKDPLSYFEDREISGAFQYDAYFQDDGNHALFYAPYSANTGFYYLRNNERTMALINALLLQGDHIITTKSHQIPLTFHLQEMASLHGLTIYIFSRTTDDFPGGHAYHRRRPFMKDMITGKNIQPYIFHMSWTESKVNKMKFYQQMGEWFVRDECSAGWSTANDVQALIKGGTGCCLAEPVVKCHYRDK